MRSIAVIISCVQFFSSINASRLQLPRSQSPIAFPNNNLAGLASAKDNAPQIFNAIHSAFRQWGSSLKHNGMSFFPVTIPANTQFYHGTHSAEPVEGMEWLAFEIEHAELFARSGRPPGKGRPGRPSRPGGPGGPGSPPSGEIRFGDEPGQGQVVANGADLDKDAGDFAYLHQYRTTRALERLLYLDGMSAGKTSVGTLDSQDFILRNASKSTDPRGDFNRAKELCALGAEWQIEGFLRMEAGFELILCNFADGVEFVSATQRPLQQMPEGYDELQMFEMFRGIGMRYQGFPAGRVVVDFSSMVSAFFYAGINLTNSDPSRPDLPRLSTSDPNQLAQVKSDLQQVLSQDSLQRHSIINWQNVVDMIVTRYSDRLQFMASNSTSQAAMLSEIHFLLNVFSDYSSSEFDVPLAVEKCSTHFLKSSLPQTDQDALVHTAISTVSQKICSALFEARSLLLADESDGNSVLDDVKTAIRELMDYLDWSTWLECGKCAFDETCFVAIWPWGSKEDHYRPRCMKQEEISHRRGYWDLDHWN